MSRIGCVQVCRFDLRGLVSNLVVAVGFVVKLGLSDRGYTDHKLHFYTNIHTDCKNWNRLVRFLNILNKQYNLCVGWGDIFDLGKYGSGKTSPFETDC